jgi:predicted metal-dependent hydrolase
LEPAVSSSPPSDAGQGRKIIELDGITIDVVRKRIKHVHLSVHRTRGVRISAPLRASLDAIRLFATSKLDWIRKHQARLQAHAPELRPRYVDRETHLVWGSAYSLEVIEEEAAPSVQVRDAALTLRVRPGADCATRAAVVGGWYRQQVTAEVPALIRKWEPRLSVAVSGFSVRRMTTRWGTCNVRRRSIRLNAELARKPRECLEYVVVHEMVHLIEPSHNARFTGLLDRFMPEWRHHRAELNQPRSVSPSRLP